MTKKSQKSVKKPVTKSSARAAQPKHEPTRGLYGWITHTDFASHDPAATKAWCAKVLGWTFKPSFPIPGGEYHLFAYSAQGGGSIHPTGLSESPGSVPFVHVADAAAVFAKAVSEGAEEIMAPTRVMEGVTLAIVRAPGGDRNRLFRSVVKHVRILCRPANNGMQRTRLPAYLLLR